MVGRNRIENLMVELGAVARLLGIGDIFAEIVDGHAHARAIYGLRGAHRIGDFGTCNETARNPVAEGRLLGEATQGLVFRKTDKEGSQHEEPSSGGGMNREMPCMKVTESCITPW